MVWLMMGDRRGAVQAMVEETTGWRSGWQGVRHTKNGGGRTGGDRKGMVGRSKQE